MTTALDLYRSEFFLSFSYLFPLAASRQPVCIHSNDQEKNTASTHDMRSPTSREASYLFILSFGKCVASLRIQPMCCFTFANMSRREKSSFTHIHLAYYIHILVGQTVRVLSTCDVNLIGTSSVLRKINGFIFFNAATIASWLITLAAIDRWLSSSIDANRRRRRSTLKNAQRGAQSRVQVMTMTTGSVANQSQQKKTDFSSS